MTSKAPQTTEEQFAEDLLSLITDKPRLVADIIGSLRGGMNRQYDVASKRRWRNLRDSEVEEVAAAFGAYIASRPHGAGIAIYVSSAPFQSVIDRFGKAVPVTPFARRGGLRF
jgi:hypothetical protein